MAIGETRELKERVVEINRVAKVVKGGRRFSFTALVVIGDEVDRVGVGYGKAREVPLAITKAVDDAKKNLFTVPKHGTTITHESLGQFDAARVFLRPASEGTGVIAGGGVRAVLELAGIRDVLAKSLGTTNPINMAKATTAALRQLRRPEDIARQRGKAVSEILPPARRPVGEERAPKRARAEREAAPTAVAGEDARGETLLERAKESAAAAAARAGDVPGAGAVAAAAETVVEKAKDAPGVAAAAGAAEAVVERVKESTSGDDDEEKP